MISTGWTILRQPDRDDAGGQGANPECREADYSRQAFYPLTLPLTVGPGSISVAITVGTNRPEGSEWHWPTDRRDAPELGFDRPVHLRELSLRGTDRALPAGVHRGADSPEPAERPAADGGSVAGRKNIPHFGLKS